MLTDNLKHHAKYHGGKDMANRKRHLAQVTTALRKLHADCDGNAAALTGLLSENELVTLWNAAGIVARVADHLDADAKAADKIRRDFDKRLDEALRAVRELPSETIADKIALAELAGLNHALRTLARDCAQYGTTTMLRDLLRDAQSCLATRIANKAQEPGLARAILRADLPAAYQRHAELISTITTLAVSQRLERANRAESIPA